MTRVKPTEAGHAPHELYFETITTDVPFYETESFALSQYLDTLTASTDPLRVGPNNACSQRIYALEAGLAQLQSVVGHLQTTVMQSNNLMQAAQFEEEELRKKQIELSNRERDLDSKESELRVKQTGVEAALVEQKTKFDEHKDWSPRHMHRKEHELQETGDDWSDELILRERVVDSKEEYINAQLEALHKDEACLAQERSAFREVKSSFERSQILQFGELDAFQNTPGHLDKRKVDLDDREERLMELQTSLTFKEEALRGREEELDKRINDIAQRDVALQRKEQNYNIEIRTLHKKLSTMGNEKLAKAKQNEALNREIIQLREQLKAKDEKNQALDKDNIQLREQIKAKDMDLASKKHAYKTQFNAVEQKTVKLARELTTATAQLKEVRKKLESIVSSNVTG